MSSLHSARWHRVAALKPRLVSTLRVRRQRLRGETWFVLADPTSGRSVRLNRTAYALAGRFDGGLCLQSLWDAQLARPGEPATQDEVIDLLAQLREAALLQVDRAADFDRLLPHLDKLARPKGRASLLAIRVPLADPSALLDRLQALPRWLFSRTALVLWTLAMVMLVLLAVEHAPALWAHAQLWMMTPRFALLAAVLYVPIKLLHELGHGLAVRRWGGQVHEAGVTFMLLMPVPYVNASAASSFPRRSHRVAVSAAGIMVELSIAALALPLWLWLDDGWLRDVAFVSLAITGVSTLLFNGNPLQRLDGYYVFTDALSLPNLGPRSRNWWLDFLRRRGLGLADIEPMAIARGERPWLALYAPLSWLYSLLIATVAVAWLGQWSLALGLLCALLLGWQMGLRPVWRLLTQLRRSALARRGSARRWQWLATGGALGLVVMLLLPWPDRTLVQGVVWPSDQAQLRADEDGFVESVPLLDGASVQPGTLVLQLSNPALQAQFERQRARIAAIEAELYGAMPSGQLPHADARAGDRQAELAAAQAERDHLQRRLDLLSVRALVAGRLALPQAGDLTGQFVRRGSLLGQVLTDAPPIVRIAMPEADARELQRDAQRISVRLSAQPRQAADARLLRDSGSAVMQLPSAALSRRHGGPVATDPRDAQDLQPMQPVVLLDVQLAAGAAGGRIGERAWVRFDGGMAPLALQWSRDLRRVVMQRFNPQF